MTIRYVIAVLLSAVLIAHFSGHPPVQLNNQGKATSLKAHTVAVHNVQPQPIERTAQKPPAASPTGVQTATVATPKPQVAQITYATGCSTYDSMFRKYDWNVSVAEAICMAESRGNPNAISNANINYDGIPDYGLMQIHGEYILNPQANIARAYSKYLSQGWRAWSTYNSGIYERYL